MITQNIIGYNLSSLSSKRIYAFDPQQLIKLPEGFSPATEEEVDMTLKKAFEAWRTYRNIDVKQRAAFLSGIADGIEEITDVLVKRIMNETAYTEARIIIELRRTCAQLRMYAGIIMDDDWRDIKIEKALPERKPTPRPDLRKMNMAIGPVIVFAASNFPLAYSTAGGDTTSALAAGCPVIVKAHESHLGTNALVAEVIMNAAKKTGMPDGVFSSLNGDGVNTGQQLVMHPLTAGVGFTGSLKGGRALFDLGSKRENPIPVFAEMGSVNPVFLLPGKLKASSADIAKMYAGSITLGVGQLCTNPGLIIGVDSDELKTFVQDLGTSVQQTASGLMLHPGISKAYKEKKENALIQEDVQLVAESETHLKEKENEGVPTIATASGQAFLNNPILHQEVFGPYSLVIRCKDMNEMTEVAKHLEGQLTSTLMATEDDIRNNDELIEAVKNICGRFILNGVPTGVEVCLSMHHGGPFPATTDSRFTSVGADGIKRFARPIAFQNWPNDLLPGELKDENPLNIWRTVNNELKK